MAIPANITDTLLRLTGIFDDLTVQRQRASSPWSTMSNKGVFEPGKGVVRTAVLFERSGPTTTYDWTPVSVNDGSGNSCVPNADIISNASTTYTHQLYQKAINSIRWCWNDLYTAWDVEDQIYQIVRNFTASIVDEWENWDRDNYVAIAAHKCVFSGGTLIDNGATSFALTTPDSYATPDLMDEVYQRLLQDGADHESEVGKEDGASVFMLFLGFEQSRALVKGNEGVRNDVRWSSDADELLKPFSIKRVLNGFAHIVDTKAPRYNFTAGAWVRVPFYTTAAATNGTKLVVNPAYQTALYEDVIVFLRNVMRREMPQPMTSFGNGTSFDRPNFTGDVRWLNIPNEEINPDGNIGFFRATLQASARPLNPNLGYAIRTKRCPGQLAKTTCTGS